MLCRAGRTVHLTISTAGRRCSARSWIAVALSRFDPAPFGDLGSGHLVYTISRLQRRIASGSFRTAGMVLAPCSMSTLAAVAHGITANLATRAADVHLKERRKLIWSRAETPLSLVHIENMAAVTRAGAIVLPAMPGWYHRPASLDDLIDFVVARIVDQLGVEVDLIRRWGGEVGG